MTIKSTYEACAIVEGFSTVEPTGDQTLAAWGYLIRTGACWQLQGWYGRMATQLIEAGYITRRGRVQWAKIHRLIDEAAEAVGVI